MSNPFLPSPRPTFPRSPCARSRGFTLVELLVVIAIISVLIAMLLPAISRSREQARRVMCGSQARGISMATLLYSEDYNNEVPENNQFGNYGRYCFSSNSRRALYVDYGVNRWQAWFCPSGLARGINMAVPNILAKTHGGWYTNPNATYSGVDWTENNRAHTGYGYWAGRSRGYAHGSTNARRYFFDQIDRFDETEFPSKRVVWGEVIKPNGGLNGALAIWTAPANGHTREGGRECDGGWFTMVDHSVVWRRVVFGVNTHEKTFQYYAYKP